MAQQSFQTNLERHAKQSLYTAKINVDMIEYCFEVFQRHIKGPRVLELGPAEGVMTQRLVRLDHEITVVEGAPQFCEMIRASFPDVNVVNALFEEFVPQQRFDTIVLGHVLEHVLDPVGILKRCGHWLTENGVIVSAVPNAMSLHRQAAVIMGALSTETDMSELDRHHGHFRVFDPISFRAAFSEAGLDLKYFGGYWLKPVSNRQIEESWTPEMVRAFMRLGERYPDIAGEIYIVAGLQAG